MNPSTQEFPGLAGSAVAPAAATNAIRRDDATDERADLRCVAVLGYN